MTTILKKDAYKLLRQEIEKRGIKNKFVANEIGISPSYFGQVLNGSRKLSTDVAVKASQVLDLPLSIFLNKS
ncbi:helix-turn-helix transcriptional regulator [Limosilactobacillus sp. STM2_1]|uniref:Helix-turn-helix transcriptional regulator n=1 Tax=Limosilactobacillus rudii TaxID=2759755 RepID=A0A7W3UJR9_9LACO|nr:helix-turn-helix transcriptional regulator [Limosilactobacillus rudii]MBB1080198.1 helix-turn-helix transcriptional regulator [Limosilactobacillus rudii]MBB1096898.1 helix-turn-helix transcriptional regulator [Limosilactobacillus rudii]MCD7133796.1 helix-turn-helix transcriptional regulator [Limosilactobacillus rudii]